MAAGSTYTPIATQTLGSAALNVTFTSISGSYTDLVVVCNNLFSASGTPNLRVLFNTDTATNYSVTVLEGNGATAYSRRQSSISGIDLGYYTSLYPTSTSTVPSDAIINVMNYSNSTTYKTVIARANSSYSGTSANVGLWRSTAAITSVRISNSSAVDFTAGSTFTLYGIAAA
jgi:hypothetical protein